jgi:hypothetical protein
MTTSFSIALAVYATANMEPEPFLAVSKTKNALQTFTTKTQTNQHTPHPQPTKPNIPPCTLVNKNLKPTTKHSNKHNPKTKSNQTHNQKKPAHHNPTTQTISKNHNR